MNSKPLSQTAGISTNIMSPEREYNRIISADAHQSFHHHLTKPPVGNYFVAGLAFAVEVYTINWCAMILGVTVLFPMFGVTHVVIILS